MGLVAREIEAGGISTLTLSMTPEFTREVGIPRVAAIEYPYGRPVGEAGDADGQREVVRSALSAMAVMDMPGQVVHLPYSWHEPARETKWHPPEASPIVKLLLADIRKMRSGKTQ